ncbi:pyridoxamine 5'-phosphate oxidase family protein [Aliiroseovarius sp. KMU-50]|uniref:Pyridoxamine 5'-phosphate oxidase family protein n=1 Tax=Aliiroseovarius salicola TaxID=3009082 RepID=A0ABT4W0M4_9RHOB|nr:pyridoxamine 5'-phosphate oxidase family protein [Aliiroseovarius sp. KMU-50]MDA5094065.1 pyridoxamine 5'-phosphate oxidase family protein [Aliiroseovarius sp. KMU-50]
MAKQFDKIEDSHRAFIEEQPMFFTGTAAPEGRVNVSPKGMDSLRVMGPNRILWLNYTGSGNETAGHLRALNRMTLMWCSFGKRPQILRAYGTARTLHPRDDNWNELIARFGEDYAARQIYDMQVEMVQTSCGYAVPQMELTGDRNILLPALKAKPEPVEDYWAAKNTATIDGLPTGVLGDNE